MEQERRCQSKADGETESSSGMVERKKTLPGTEVSMEQTLHMSSTSSHNHHQPPSFANTSYALSGRAYTKRRLR